ncbi:glycosyltransferase [Nocardioides sp.]|uniref:glycosyltransferase n=1 Tax=Nocardioides sp. TaxID=35761 RepID=UPI003783C8D7
MRVLGVVAEMGSGGAEAVVHDLALRLPEHGDEVLVASDGGWRADALAAAGVTIRRVPLRDPGPVALERSAAAVRRLLATWRPDVVHAHNVRASLAARLAQVGRRRVPVVSTVHGLADDRYAAAARLLRRCSDLVVAVSPDVRDRLLQAGLDPGRVAVIENAVPPPGPATGDVRAELGLLPGTPLVVCAARLAAPKRVDLLVDAWPEVPAAAHLLVAGDGPDRPALEARAARSAARPRITFLGDRADVGRLLAAADVVVLASDREGLPMVVLEAMAAGRPVVASAVGGLPALAGTGCLELVPPGDAGALAAAVRALLADPARRARTGAAARAVVERRFSSVRMVDDYRSVYQNVVGRAETVVTKSSG